MLLFHFHIFFIAHSMLQGRWALVVDQIIFGMKNCPSVLEAKRLWLEDRVSVAAVVCVSSFGTTDT